MAAPLDDVATWEPAPPFTPPEPAGPAHSPPVSAIGERCPSCRARVAADQRYCLECGERRGEPRLPFMDAVSFMDAAARRRREKSPATPPRRSRISPNTSLIAGVGTLLLAMGVGVLIGQSAGHSESGASGKPAVQVVKVPAAGEAVSTTTPNASSGKSGKAKTSGHSGGGHAAKSSGAAPGSSGSGAASVLHPKAKLPPPTVQVGGACNGGAGCKNGKFTGSFFGE